MPNEIIKLTQNEFDNCRLLNNKVAIQIVHRNSNDLKSGLIIVQDPDMFTSKDIKGAEEYDHSQHLDRWGVVAKVPDKLHFTPRNNKTSANNWKCDWETTIEIVIGDKVWCDYFNLHYCPIIKTETNEYWIVNYQNLIVAKRQTIAAGYGDDDISIEQTIPLNGYCLFEQINEGLTSKFLILNEKINKSKGIVKYVGSLNKNYSNIKRSDDVEIQPGQEVIFRTEAEVLLENPQHRFFEDCNLRYEQRHNIQAVIIK